MNTLEFLQTHETMAIYERFNTIIMDNLGDTNDIDELETFISGILKYGVQIGVTGLVYYNETTEIFDFYAEECEDFLEELFNNFGTDNPKEIFSNWEHFPTAQHINKNTIIWAMFEDYCNTISIALEEL